ncbi:MAG: hypothetical protein Kow00105_00200 [Phycisphaeraceae bacterium]
MRDSRYLSFRDMESLRGLSFVPRRPVRGTYAGQHPSRQQGQSVEFNDYRVYMPGDEVGDIDWKVFGRSDKLFVRRREHQTDLTAHLLIDASASMAYAGVRVNSRKRMGARWFRRRSMELARPLSSEMSAATKILSKYDYACQLAAATAFLMLEQRNRVDLAFAKDGLYRLTESRGQLQRLLNQMESIEPNGRAGLPEAIQRMNRSSRNRGLLIIYTDLHEACENTISAVSAWIHAGGEATVFHILHPDELKLPSIRQAVLIDSETEERVRLSVSEIRNSYQRAMESMCARWKRLLNRCGADYCRVTTDAVYHQAIRDYLTSRPTGETRH